MTPLVAAAVRRRQRLAEAIGDGLVVLSSAPEVARSRDTTYQPYRHNSYLYYLTTCTEAQTALLLVIVGGVVQEEIFFCRSPDHQMVQWEGAYLTPKTAPKQLCIDSAMAIDRLTEVLTNRAQTLQTLYYLPGESPPLDTTIIDLLRRRRTGNRVGNSHLQCIVDVSSVLDDMRLIKDEVEIEYIRAACHLTGVGVGAAMQSAQQASNECQVDAAITQAYRRGGGHHAFPPIVAAGRNACVLHYTDNHAYLRKNKWLLIDTGCELNGYAGDVTRTFPVGDDWPEGAASEIYDIVLAAQRRAIQTAKAGIRWQAVERAATRLLVKGLKSLKLCRGSVDEIIHRETYRRFYMHHIGHWLGLDVHDVGAMKEADGQSRILRPGMVLTVEPGLYIPVAADIPPALRGIGVRIEDDVLITDEGNDVLTNDIPKTRREIQQWMQR